MQAARAFFNDPARPVEVPCVEKIKLPEFE